MFRMEGEFNSTPRNRKPWDAFFSSTDEVDFHFSLNYTFIAYPIEKYVGWTDMSSYFIINISGVIPHFEKPLNYDYIYVYTLH